MPTDDREPDWLVELEEIAADLRAIVDTYLGRDEERDEATDELLREPEAFRFRLHDLDCNSLGTIALPYANVERGDTITLATGERYIVRRAVRFDYSVFEAMLQLERAGDFELDD